MAFKTYVVGLNYPNKNGESRLALLTGCKEGEELFLEPEPDNPHDENAIAVLRSDGKQLGYLSRNVAETLSYRSGQPKAVIDRLILGKKPGFLGRLMGEEETLPECRIEISGG